MFAKKHFDTVTVKQVTKTRLTLTAVNYRPILRSTFSTLLGASEDIIDVIYIVALKQVIVEQHA